MECVYLADAVPGEREPLQAFVGPEGLQLDTLAFYRAIGAPEPEGSDHRERWEWLLARGLTGYGFDNAYTAWVLAHPGVRPVTIECMR